MCDLAMDLLTCQYGHGCGFAGTIVTKQSRYLTVVHVQTDVFHYNFLTRSRTEFLHKCKQANDTAMATLGVLCWSEEDMRLKSICDHTILCIGGRTSSPWNKWKKKTRAQQ